MDRRHFLALPAAAAMLPGQARVQARQSPARDVVRYPDPSVRSLDPRFDKYRAGAAVVERLSRLLALLKNTVDHINLTKRYLCFDLSYANAL